MAESIGSTSSTTTCTEHAEGGNRSGCFKLCCIPLPKHKTPFSRRRRTTARFRPPDTSVAPVGLCDTNVEAVQTSPVTGSENYDVTRNVEPEDLDIKNPAPNLTRVSKLILNDVYETSSHRRNARGGDDIPFVVLQRKRIHKSNIRKISQSKSVASSKQNFDGHQTEFLLPGELPDSNLSLPQSESPEVDHVTILDDDSEAADAEVFAMDVDAVAKQPTEEYLEQCGRDNLKLARMARLINTCPDSSVRRGLIRVHTMGHLIYRDVMAALKLWSVVGHKLVQTYKDSGSKSLKPGRSVRFVRVRLEKLSLALTWKMTIISSLKDIIYNVVRAQYQFEHEPCRHRLSEEIWVPTVIEFDEQEVNFSSDIVIGLESRQQQDKNFRNFQTVVRACALPKVTRKFSEAVGAVQLFTNSTVSLVQRWAEVSCGCLPRFPNDSNKSAALDRIASESDHLDRVVSQLAHGLERDESTATFILDEVKNLDRKLESAKRRHAKSSKKRLLPKSNCPHTNRKLADFYMGARVPTGNGGLTFYQIPFRRLVNKMPVITENQAEAQFESGEEVLSPPQTTRSDYDSATA